MSSEFELARSAEKMNTYIRKYVVLAGAEKKEEVVALFEKIEQFFPQCVIMSCPAMHPDMSYLSKNSLHILGDMIETDDRRRRVEIMFARVHPADQEDVNGCMFYLHEQMGMIHPNEHYRYRCVFYYRFRKANGQYIHIRDEKAIFQLPGSVNFYYSLLRDITGERTFSGVRSELFEQGDSLFKIGEYRPSLERHSLSKRETELVGLIRQGLSVKEIAWYLNISHNTVRNIKSKLFEKYNVSNTVELLNMAG